MSSRASGSSRAAACSASPAHEPCSGRRISAGREGLPGYRQTVGCLGERVARGGRDPGGGRQDVRVGARARPQERQIHGRRIRDLEVAAAVRADVRAEQDRAADQVRRGARGQDDRGALSAAGCGGQATPPPVVGRCAGGWDRAGERPCPKQMDVPSEVMAHSMSMRWRFSTSAAWAVSSSSASTSVVLRTGGGAAGSRRAITPSLDVATFIRVDPGPMVTGIHSPGGSWVASVVAGSRGQRLEGGDRGSAGPVDLAGGGAVDQRHGQTVDGSIRQESSPFSHALPSRVPRSLAAITPEWCGTSVSGAGSRRAVTRRRRLSDRQRSARSWRRAAGGSG
ncbi:hypothetical protein DFJ69_6176 [Thermomonospora umbrina]|uniref:Uncharacterized protein n=1 Tax=Thermomonospora umbrina TaxID=111806 RepID=A0A3D9SXD3_9ACTN|nr:hypothetical protein DFJ69_6176 [Thermomonospora umbrina]